MQESRAITRKSASNLALAFVLLPKSKRDAMSALYAFCREVDDVADEESAPVEQRRDRLAAWRADVHRATTGERPEFRVNQEFQPVIQQFHLPFELFDELIKGCEMDLELKHYATFDELELYCYRVASVVGLLSIRIFGYRDTACQQYAIYLGKALQLTNILRDVRSDADRGRIYLPHEGLRMYAVTPEEVLRGDYSPRYHNLAKSIAARARNFYQLARATLPAEDRRAMVAAEFMGLVYWQLLQKLERRDFNVFSPQPVRLNRVHKCALIVKSWVHFVTGSSSPAYGTA